MKAELDKALCDKYPAIFAQRHGDMRYTCMVWGFECGDGWYDLIDRLCRNIQKVVDWKNMETNLVKGYREDTKVEASQVKEKFGTLRFYTGPIHQDIGDIIDALVSQAENRSAHTCEDCGKYGQLRGGGWIRTLCTVCAIKKKYPIKEWELKYIPEEEKENADVEPDKVAEIP